MFGTHFFKIEIEEFLYVQNLQDLVSDMYTLLLCRISHARTGLYGYVTSSWYRRDRGIGIESRPKRSDI